MDPGLRARARGRCAAEDAGEAITGVPPQHAAFVESAIPRLAADPRIVGVAAAGSLANGVMDAHSDLDFVVAVEPAHVETLMLEREAIARTLGPLLAAFTGEHVGAPQLLICLYGPPLLHVDLKFVALPDVARRVDENRVLFDRDGRLSSILASTEPLYPQPRLQWIEDRFWPWVHYIAGKIARGELFEAIDGIGFLRARVIGPLALAEIGATPNGVRRFESLRPDLAPMLRETVASHDPASCARALRTSIALYRALRDRTAPPDLVRRGDAEREAIAFFEQVEEST